MKSEAALGTFAKQLGYIEMEPDGIRPSSTSFLLSTGQKNVSHGLTSDY
jgi:hypothetical protein